MGDPIEPQHDICIPIGGEVKREQCVIIVGNNDKWPSTSVIVKESTDRSVIF
jgi:hypothetical protein